MKRLILIFALAAGTAGASESITSRAGVATGSRYATQAAVAALRGGGSAMDAATAAAFVLAVARPDAAGLGGGGFLIYYDSAEKATWAVDFRETAPWTPASGENGEEPAVPQGLTAAGTPGFVPGLREAHERFGKAKWRDLLRSAILLAEEGVDVDSALAGAFHAAEQTKTLDATARGVFYRGSSPGMSPTRLVQPDLATTLTRMSKVPSDAWEGTTAEKIVELMARSDGRLTIRDFREYRPVWRAPLRIEIGAYSIQTAPPPARGGVAIASMLAILGSYQVSKAELGTAGPSHLLVEAERRATFDSKRVVGDPGYSRIAIASILSAERAAFWRATFDPERATSTPAIEARSAAPSDHTTHISIVDEAGNFASLTLSLSGKFGSGVMVPGTGIILNNALGDFTRPATTGHPNAPVPRKRPATPLAPLILFREGRPILAAGSSGGDAIPACLTGMILRLTQKSATLREAIEAPRFHQPDYPDRIMFEPELAATMKTLESMGHSTRSTRSIGEINAVMIDGKRIISISDPRGKGATGGF
jgi:gamma-glutamyltranspeptidase/glutathione hydrolase